MTMSNDTKTMDVAQKAPQNKKAVVLHGGNTIAAPSAYRTYDLRMLAAAPSRRAECVQLSTLDSFTEYVKQRNRAHETCVFVGDKCVKAVFDFCAEGGKPAWQTDVALFCMEHSTEWKAWRAFDRKFMSQRAFLEFLEDNLDTIAEPNGTEFYALAEQFHAMKSVEYMSGYRASSGETRLVYNETLKGAQRELALPAGILLQVPVIRGAEEVTTYNIKARIKFRIDNESHKLELCYELVRPDIPERNAVRDFESHFKQQGIEVYAGELKTSNYARFCDFAEKAYELGD